MKVITQPIEQCKATAAIVTISVRYSAAQLSQLGYPGTALQYLCHSSLTLPSGLPESSPTTAFGEQTWFSLGSFWRKQGNKTPCTAGDMDSVNWHSQLLIEAWQGTAKWQTRPNTLGIWVVTLMQIIDGQPCWITQSKHVILDSYRSALSSWHFNWTLLTFMAVAEIKPLSLWCNVAQEPLPPHKLGLSQKGPVCCQDCVGTNWWCRWVAEVVYQCQKSRR